MTEQNDTNPQKANLAVALTTFNSMRTLPKVLDSVWPIPDRIIVIDSGSTDGTVEFCREKGCKVIHREWEGSVKQRRFSFEKCRPAKWILSLDSDEILEPDLQKAIREAVEMDDPAVSGYEINRKLWYLGGWLNHLYFPEWRLRLFRPEKARVTGKQDQYHDRIEVDGNIARLNGICKHDSYADLQDHAVRQIKHAARTAGRETEKGRWYHFFTSPLAATWKMLFRKPCFLDSNRGWIASTMKVSSKLLKQSFHMLDRLEQEEKEKQQ